MDSRTTVVTLVFTAVYAGMLFGRVPRLKLDRTGVALLGAIVLLATGVLRLDEASGALDVPTLTLLFSLMVLSAQLRLGGFYTWLTRGLAELERTPAALLLATIVCAGALSAIFSNDVVCLAMAPVLFDACDRRRIDPLPFLLGLACASNVGSAATLIGNPQNMLIGQVLGLSFVGYATLATPPSAIGLGCVWGVIAWQWRGRWTRTQQREPLEPGALEPLPPFDRWQTTKGLVVATALVVAFLGEIGPRELVALGGCGLLLCSRRLHSREMLGLVDWQLLILFIGLFIVNEALRSTGALDLGVAWAAAHGADLRQPGWLFGATVILSNAVSNVPAVMLLLPLADSPLGGPILALASTLAGNLLLVGSIANLIVAGAAERRGLRIAWLDHARTGIPVTLLTLASAGAWLWLVSPSTP